MRRGGWYVKPAQPTQFSPGYWCRALLVCECGAQGYRQLLATLQMQQQPLAGSREIVVTLDPFPAAYALAKQHVEIGLLAPIPVEFLLGIAFHEQDKWRVQMQKHGCLGFTGCFQFTPGGSARSLLFILWGAETKVYSLLFCTSEIAHLVAAS